MHEKELIKQGLQCNLIARWKAFGLKSDTIKSQLTVLQYIIRNN